MKIIELGSPYLTEEEVQAVAETVRSGWLTMGEKVHQFEHAFARLHQVKDAVAVNSCTAGLHLILSALGLGPDMEVLLPSMSFVATANAVLYTGAKPVFVDIISPEMPHISLEHARTLLSSKTKAVIIMHYGGYRIDVPAWRQFCDQHDLYLIEDAAHAPGLDGVGHLSDGAAFSFFSNKNMTSAEGGMVIVQNDALRDRIKKMRAHGMTRATLDRHRGHANSYDVVELGFNYRLDEMRAALGLVQLKKLSQFNQKRIQLSLIYRQHLAQLPVQVPFQPDHPTVAHLMTVLLPPNQDRSLIMERMRNQGIQTSIHYPPIHLFNWHSQYLKTEPLSHTEHFAQRVLTLPLYPQLTESDLNRVINALDLALN